MTVKMLFLLGGLCVCSFGAKGDGPFLSGKPVWPEGREKDLNVFAGFRATVDGAAAERAVVRLTGATVYRVFVNGEFLGYGPARGPKDFFRVDEWPLRGRCRPGPNVIAVEVAGYNVNSFYYMRHPSFVQAEVVAGGTVLASTAGEGAAFEGGVLASRLQRVQRYSFQRDFSEVYRLAPDSDAWRTGAPWTTQKLAVQPACALLPRIAPYPRFDKRVPVSAPAQGVFKKNPEREVLIARAAREISPKLLGFTDKEVETAPFYEVQRQETVSRRALAAHPALARRFSLSEGQFRILDFGENNTGFFGAALRCEGVARVYFVFDELLSDGDVSVTRMKSCNVVAYDLTAPGDYRVEVFEPYTLRYLKVIVTGATCEFSDPYLREYVNPDTERAVFDCSDASLNLLFEAARSTFKQNAVDLFMDCPSRERAGWLCDSFFTARVASDLCGNTDIERAFFQNYALPSGFEFLPDGMLPMCYPSDHNDGVYIPNYALWFVIQLDEYVRRSNDRAMAEALKARVLALLDFFKTYKNSDGLLEKLPSWVFVEWSHANDLVQDVNYPSNMTYAEVLSCAARLYGLPALEAEAARLRETIRRQSFDGTFFVDNAKRQPDGSLKPTGERTETCQYYAFFFHVATPQRDPALWETLRTEFGPQRRQTKKYPELCFSNALPGHYLRLELLSRLGLSAQMIEESKVYFLNMAEQTGTLWEHDRSSDSCCHGFASHVAHVLYRDVLGLFEADAVGKRVRLRFTDTPLQTCQGVMPLGSDRVAVSWRKAGGVFYFRVRTPPGFEVEVDTSLLSLRAVRER